MLQENRCRGETCPIREVINVVPARAYESRWAREWALPRRQARVAALMIQGLTDRDIADQLCLTIATVRTYTRLVLAAAGVSNRTALVIAAFRVVAGDGECVTL